jgi:hypothetical protein
MRNVSDEMNFNSTDDLCHHFNIFYLFIFYRNSGAPFNNDDDVCECKTCEEQKIVKSAQPNIYVAPLACNSHMQMHFYYCWRVLEKRASVCAEQMDGGGNLLSAPFDMHRNIEKEFSTIAMTTNATLSQCAITITNFNSSDVPAM